MTNYFDNKRIIVTGSTGLIGSNLIAQLLKHNVKSIVGIHRNFSSYTLRHTDKIIPMSDSRLNLISCDLTCGDIDSEIIDSVDIVFHCAASTFGANIMKTDPLRLVSSNILSNTRLIDKAYLSGVKKFVFISSTTVYPDTGEIPVNESMDIYSKEPFVEYYGVGNMKRISEKLCEIYDKCTIGDKKMSCVVVRPSNIYGQGDKFKKGEAHVLGNLIRKTVERITPFEMFGDGNDVRDMIYIDDFIRGLLLTTEKINEYNPINIGSGYGTTINNMAELCFEYEKFHPIIERKENTLQMIPKRYVDCNKAIDCLGFSATTSLKEGIKKTIEWYKQNYNNSE